MVRQAMFNILGSMGAVEGARALDLFAGTGAIGIEALSRGAAHVTFVERDGPTLAVLRENLATTGFDGADCATVVRGDALAFVSTAGSHASAAPPFDLAFADPPYSFDGWAELLARLPAALAVLESDRPVEPGDGWQVLRVKHYGGSVVTLITPRPTSPKGDR